MMKSTLFAFAIAMVGFGSTSHTHGAISLAGGVHTENFDSLPSTGWSFTHWGLTAVPTSGYNGMMTNGANQGQISTPTGGTTFPLPEGGVAPLKPAGSYLNYGFSGQWLTNTTGTDGQRVARVEYNNLGVHDSINLSFLLGAGDSIDAGEGTFELAIDGVVVFRREFTGANVRSTATIEGYPNVGSSSLLTTHTSNANLDGYYREAWATNPTSTDSRSVSSWTLDSAHEFNGNFAHTGDTLTVEWRIIKMNSTYTDEFIAIDNLRVQVVPEPSQLILCGAAMAGLMFRRRR